MLISNRNGFISDENKFVLSNNELHEIHEITDLGVLFDNHLSFYAHITGIIARAKQRLFLIYKCFISKDTTLLLKAYTIYVRPLLEYCSPIWSPHTKHDIDRIESVQRLFTKRLIGFSGLSYAQRLSKANLCSLELRRLHADLVMCYKIVHKEISINCDNLFELDKHNRTRGHIFKLKSKRPRLDTRLHFFGYRVIAVWNSLSRSTIEATTVASFKRCLHDEYLSVFLLNDFDFDSV
jgi:hypothetical protein